MRLLAGKAVFYFSKKYDLAKIKRDCSEERLCLVFRGETSALLGTKTSALLRRKTCAVLRARMS